MLSPAARCKPSICTVNTILAAQMRQGQFEQARPIPRFDQGRNAPLLCQC